MILEKSAIAGLAISSVTTVFASISQVDWLATTGVVTTCGLAAISLYQKFREEKRRQDSADRAEDARLMRAEIEALKEARARWKALYDDLKPGDAA